MDRKKISDAYMYYNTLRPSDVVFYRTGDFYKPFTPDIDRISAHLPEWVMRAREGGCLVPVEEALDFVATAHRHGLKVRLVECLDEDGKYDVPDIQNILREAATDY